jgi:hypothetical protein
MAETWLEYNGIKLRNVLTKRFDQTAEYDPSGTDLVCFKFSLTVVGYMHASAGRAFGTILPAPQTSGANAYSAVRSLLMEPRGELTYTLGANAQGVGTTVLRSVPYTGNNARLTTFGDVKNGPQPRNVSITHIVGSDTLEIEYTIDTWLVECRDGTTAAPANDIPNNNTGVLSNRWSCSDSIDQNMRTTRTISGLLRTANGHVNPNALRNYVVPRLQLGFRRDSMNFRVTPDALSLEYNIVDKEVTHSPPPPATSWSYTAREESGDAKMCFASIDLTLAGPRDVDKGELVRVGVAIVKSRLYGGSFANGSAKLENLVITDSYGDNINTINIQARVMRTTKDGETVLAARTKFIGKPISAADLAGVSPAYNADRSRGNYPADVLETAGPLPLVAAWHAYLQTPCNSTHRIDNAYSSQNDGPIASSRVDYQLTGSVTTAVGDPTNYTSSDHDESIYTHYELESKYQTSENNVALPIAGQRYAATATTSTLSVIGLAMETATRVIRIVAQRVGKQPKLPNPAKTYAFGQGTAHLLRRVVTPKVPDRTADGKELHTVLAEFTYALTVPPPPNQVLPVGVNPWEDSAFTTHLTDTALLSGANP